MNPSELNYQVVSTFDKDKDNRTMEEGKKYRQYLAGVVGEFGTLILSF